MKKIIVTRQQLKEAFNTMYSTPELRKIQKKIYNAVSEFCGKMHHDDAWQNVKHLIGLIRSVNGVTDMNVGAGQYFNYLNPEKGAYREYETTVITNFGNLYGYIRCNAAGTMDDIFKYYDMTISLYPDKTKDINEGINDSQKTFVNFTGTNASEMGINAQEKYNDALRTGLKQNSIALQGKSTNNNASDRDETIISFDSSKGNIKDAVTNSVQNAVNNGADINKINVQGNAEDITNGTNESKTYSKKNVEIARLHEMKKNGKTMTKKQLSEEIANSISLKEKLSSIKNPFKLLNAVKSAFGDAALQSLSTTDLIDGTVRIFENATISQQEKFLQIIDGNNTLTEAFNDDDFGYYVITAAINLDTGEFISDYNESDCFKTIQNTFETIEHLCTYPEDSYVYNMRYNDNLLPLFTIVTDINEPADKKLNYYMSNIDRGFYNVMTRKYGINITLV